MPPSKSINTKLLVRELSDGIKFESSVDDVSVRLSLRGEWNAFRKNGRFYRRCMDGRVISSQGALDFTQNEVQLFHGEIANVCRQMLSKNCGSLSSHTAQILERCTKLPDHFYHQLQDVYFRAYPEGVPVLPPDRYRDLVIPITMGCPNGQCSFCAFYRDKPFSLIEQNRWNEVVSSLEQLFPGGVAGRDGIFLGSANALALSFVQLESVIDRIVHLFGLPARGVSCFGDADRMGVRKVEQWQVLRDKGLVQVVLGLETGADVLRERIGKSRRLEKTRGLAFQLKQAGVAVGLTVLTGFIGEEFFAAHKEATCQFIQSLELTAEDRVYISPWFTDGAKEPESRAYDEAHEIKRVLSGQTAARVTAYSSHNFYYFS
ncbi:radical SAM protein [Parendozoicomonas sp. Alg238-R29]|uniref:radical SAM protein n=1 Tax=Parendozoicomonas sp. Alg238-R29 TaxID=2993446 RepID=UPI00248D4C7A|nr:radical SAM protein [Parendozoicomonas sp. Alg238-R29]